MFKWPFGKKKDSYVEHNLEMAQYLIDKTNNREIVWQIADMEPESTAYISLDRKGLITHYGVAINNFGWATLCIIDLVDKTSGDCEVVDSFGDSVKDREHSEILEKLLSTVKSQIQDIATKEFEPTFFDEENPYLKTIYNLHSKNTKRCVVGFEGEV